MERIKWVRLSAWGVRKSVRKLCLLRARAILSSGLDDMIPNLFENFGIGRVMGRKKSPEWNWDFVHPVGRAWAMNAINSRRESDGWWDGRLDNRVVQGNRRNRF